MGRTTTRIHGDEAVWRGSDLAKDQKTHSLGTGMNELWGTKETLEKPNGAGRGVRSQTEAPDRTKTHRGSERLDCGLRLEQNGNSVPNREHALALVALEAIFAAQHQRLTADGAGEYFQKLG